MFCGAQVRQSPTPSWSSSPHISRFHRIRSHGINIPSSSCWVEHTPPAPATSVMLLSDVHHRPQLYPQFKPHVYFYLYPLHISDTTCPTIILPPAKETDCSTSPARCLCFTASAAGRTANLDVLPRIDVCSHVLRQKKTDVFSYNDSAEMSRV